MCATFAVDFFQRGIGSQFGAWLGGHCKSGGAQRRHRASVDRLDHGLPGPRRYMDKLTKAQAKVEHKRLTLDRAPRQGVLPGRGAENSDTEYDALRLRINTHRGAVFGICHGIGFPPRITDSSRTSRHVGKVPTGDIEGFLERGRQPRLNFSALSNGGERGPFVNSTTFAPTVA